MTNSTSPRFAHWPILLVFISVLVYFLPVFLLKQSFLSGDHWEQQYPWAALMQQMLRLGELPWWTTRIGCGFPILAEGQIGAFYPLNWIFYFFLPLKMAYSGIILFHYLLGAFLFYVFVRRLRFSASACLFSTLIYVFGSTQCGYFYYNFISQKTVVWLPLALLLMDRLRNGGGFFDVFALSATLALAMFGGYVQVAVYLWLFVFVYFIYFFVQKPSKTFFYRSLLAAVLAIAVSLLQLIPTFELAALTARGDIGKEFSYVGSMNPLGFLTLIHPSWDGWLRSELYVSILGLFLVCFGFVKPKENHQKFFIGVMVVFLLLALGKFSPLYRLIIELTHFSGFRTPIKFLFFVGFSLAVSAGYGWDRFFNSTQKLSLRGWLFFCCALIPVGTFPFWGSGVLGGFKGRGVELIQAYVERFIFNQPGHPHSLASYLKKAADYYESIMRMIDWSLPQNFWQVVLILVSLILIGGVLRQSARGRIVKTLFFVLLFCDLFFYGTTSIRANLESYSGVSSPSQGIPGVSAALDSHSIYRVADYYLEGEDVRRYPLFPSQNMVYSQDHLGIYTPLVLSGWTQLMSGLTYSNDSILAQFVDPKVFFSRLGEISALNVKYLFSITPLTFPGWIERQSGKIFIYENPAVLPRYFMYYGDLPASLASMDVTKVRPISSLELEQLELKVMGASDEVGWLIGSEIHYPGWKAELNGAVVPIEKFAGIFRAVQIKEPGEFMIRMSYQPKVKQWSVFGLALWGALLCLTLFHLIARPLFLRLGSH